MKKIFFLLIYFLFILNVEAYSNDLFQIDIPEEYKIENNKAIYKWNKDDSYKRSFPAGKPLPPITGWS